MNQKTRRRDEKAAPHGKHMSCINKKLYRGVHIYRGKKTGGVAWRDGEGGRDVKKGRVDPVRSAASLVNLQTRDKEKAMQHWGRQINCTVRSKRPVVTKKNHNQNHFFVI